MGCLPRQVHIEHSEPVFHAPSQFGRHHAEHAGQATDQPSSIDTGSQVEAAPLNRVGQATEPIGHLVDQPPGGLGCDRNRIDLDVAGLAEKQRGRCDCGAFTEQFGDRCCRGLELLGKKELTIVSQEAR